MSNNERRISTAKFEVLKTAGNMTQIKGYAARFNSLSSDLGGFRERIQPGAFSNTLRDNQDVFLLYAHDMSNVLARTTAGTLSLREDNNGLAFDATLPDTTLGRDVGVNLDNGNLDEMSFGFNVDQDDWDQTDDGDVIRSLNSVSLFEVSIVPRGAYGSAATVSLRSAPADILARLTGTDNLYDAEMVAVLLAKRRMTF
jgi:hypothetical protein